MNAASRPATRAARWATYPGGEHLSWRITGRNAIERGQPRTTSPDSNRYACARAVRGATCVAGPSTTTRDASSKVEKRDHRPGLGGGLGHPQPPSVATGREVRGIGSAARPVLSARHSSPHPGSGHDPSCVQRAEPESAGPARYGPCPRVQDGQAPAGPAGWPQLEAEGNEFRPSVRRSASTSTVRRTCRARLRTRRKEKPSVLAGGPANRVLTLRTWRDAGRQSTSHGVPAARPTGCRRAIWKALP